MDQEGKIQLEEVDETIVAFRYPVSKDTHRSPIQVRVMTSDGFEQFVSSLSDLDSTLVDNKTYLDDGYDAYRKATDPGPPFIA